MLRAEPGAAGRRLRMLRAEPGAAEPGAARVLSRAGLGEAAAAGEAAAFMPWQAGRRPAEQAAKQCPSQNGYGRPDVDAMQCR